MTDHPPASQSMQQRIAVERAAQQSTWKCSKCGQVNALSWLICSGESETLGMCCDGKRPQQPAVMGEAEIDPDVKALADFITWASVGQRSAVKRGYDKIFAAARKAIDLQAQVGERNKALSEFQCLAQQVKDSWDCGGNAWWSALEKIRAAADLAPSAPETP